MGEIRGCVFDAYGTLFDVHSATARCEALPEAMRPAVSALWREKQLQYTWLRTLQGRHADFWQVTGEALDFALEVFGVEDRRIRQGLMDLYLILSPYPDVAEAIASLRRAGVAIAILSNGSPDMLSAVVRRAGMEGLFDQVLSVESVGAFKTDRRVYQFAADQLGLSPEATAFVSANGW
ncbi:MAG TPA: haloacid dehalogenase type II, partial [Caulobacteraceae bacterium]|nr:haloacid dehalogenase type II [Caulobacteraceae bacterium]